MNATITKFSLLLVLLMGCPAPDGPRYKGAGNDEPQYGGTLHYSVSSNLRTLDPHIGFDTISAQMFRLLWDGLLDYDKESKLVPNMLEALPQLQEDGKTYRFVLKKGVHFHDSPAFKGGKGREILAEDIRWSLTRMLDPATHSPGFSFYMSIDGVKEFREGKAKTIAGLKVVDSHTLDITLAKPDQGFLNAMAMNFAYPVAKENYEHHGDQVKFHPVGNGPYVLTEWERDVRLEFDKNKNYWRKGLPYIDSFIIDENVSIEVATMRFRAGDEDHLDRPRQPDYLELVNAPKWKGYWRLYQEGTVYFMGLNTELPPLDNVHFRRALAFAIDREKLARISKGRNLPTGQMMPPGLFGHIEDLKEEQHLNLEIAKKEMALAGYPDGYPKKITMINYESAGAKSMAESLMEDFKKIGVQLDVKPMAFALYLQETATRGRAQSYIGGWHQDFPDPISFYDTMLHSSGIKETNSENKSFYSNTKLDEILDAARAESDPDIRLGLYEEAANIVSHDAPFAFLSNTVTFQIWQPYLKDYVGHPLQTRDLRFTWLDLPKKRVD